MVSVQSNTTQVETVTTPSDSTTIQSEMDSKQSPTSENEMYRHHALPSNNHIRLLRLAPGGVSGLLHGTLHVYHIDECPAYTAVSYAWGTTLKVHTIDVTYSAAAGQERSLIICHLKVNERVSELLRWLRGPEFHRMLWIDSICIDQSSETEKNHQVKLMGRVYAQANYVVAALGSDDDAPHVHNSLERAFQFMRVATCQENQECTLSHSCTAGNHYLDISEIRERWSDVLALFNREYWNRKWIIQEIVIARSVVLQIGRHYLPMNIVESFLSQKYDMHTSFFDGPGGFAPFVVNTMASHRLSKYRKPGWPQNLCFLMALYSTSRCSVESDHVYALYNMIGDHRAKLEVDYSENAALRTLNALMFLRDHDDLAEAYSVCYAATLVRQLGRSIRWTDLFSNHIARSGFSTIVRQYGQTRIASETVLSQYFRRIVKPLTVSARFSCKFSRDESKSEFFTLAVDSFMPVIDSGLEIGPDDMIHIRITSVEHKPLGPNIYALADVFETGDLLWHFLYTGVAFVMRPVNGNKEDLEHVGESREPLGTGRRSC